MFSRQSPFPRRFFAGLFLLALAAPLARAEVPAAAPAEEVPARGAPPAEDARRHHRWIIPAGQEQSVQQFLAPVSLGSQWEGHSLGGISIEFDRIVLRFVDAAKNPAVIEVRHPEDTGRGRVAAGPVLLEKIGAVPEALFEAVRASFASGKRPRHPWADKRDALGSSRFTWSAAGRVIDVNPLALQRALATLLALLLALLTLALLRRRLREGSFADRLGAGALLGVSAGALLLRIALSPRTFLHEYYHVGDHVDDFLFSHAGGHYLGATGPALYRLANTLFGGTEEAIFTTNTILASLTVAAAGLLALSLFRNWAHALFTAILLALLPLHLRFSAAEDLCIAGTLFATWSLALFVEFVRVRSEGGRGRLEMAAAVCATALAMQARPELLSWPAVLVAYVVLARPLRDWRLFFSAPVLLGLAALLALVAPRLSTLYSLGGHAPGRTNPAAAAELVAFFDPDMVPAVVWLLFIVGSAALALAGRGRVVTWLLFCAAAYIGISLSFFTNPPPYNLRSQMMTAPMFLLLAGAAAPLIASWLPRQRWAPVVVVLALTAPVSQGLVRRTAAVAAVGDQQQEWEFLKATVPDLLVEEGTELIAVSGRGPGVLGTFPVFLVHHPERLRFHDLGELEQGKPYPEPHAKLLFYKGMYCHYEARTNGPDDPWRTLCDEVLASYTLEPVATRTIPGPGFSRLHYAEPPYEIGFYRVTGRRGAPPSEEGEAVKGE